MGLYLKVLQSFCRPYQTVTQCLLLEWGNTCLSSSLYCLLVCLAFREYKKNIYTSTQQVCCLLWERRMECNLFPIHPSSPASLEHLNSEHATKRAFAKPQSKEWLEVTSVRLLAESPSLPSPPRFSFLYLMKSRQQSAKRAVTSDKINYIIINRGDQVWILLNLISTCTLIIAAFPLCGC